MDDEGIIDPLVTEWLTANPERSQPFEELDPELLELARGDFTIGTPRTIAEVSDEVADGVPVRIYRNDEAPTGLVVYFHGGGWVIGSLGIMDNIARALTLGSGAVVVSVGYRLAPEHPYPAGLDDCETVTRWAHANAARFGVSPHSIVVAGESAGGNLAAAVSLRLRDASEVPVSGQVLIYPGVGGSRMFPSRQEFDGLILTLSGMKVFWGAYTGGRDLDDDPYAAPLSAPSLAGLPPALVVLGGCDLLRDEGRAYATRLREEGVDVDEVCYAGQPHGFVNFELPAAEPAFDHIGSWIRGVLA
jgi:acetyl esterase